METFILEINKKGKRVEAIPEPYYKMFTKECDCGKKFFYLEKYREHYAYVHIHQGE